MALRPMGSTVVSLPVAGVEEIRSEPVCQQFEPQPTPSHHRKEMGLTHWEDTTSLSVCPLCSNAFNFESEHRPMSLSCGHSVCLQCVPKLKNVCPTCTRVFTTSVPNYLWSEFVASSASTASKQSATSKLFSCLLPGHRKERMSLLECTLCFNLFDFNTNHRPMSLSCGHSVCLECVPKLKNVCATCKMVFNTSVPNYLCSELATAAFCLKSQTGLRAMVEKSGEAITLQAAATQVARPHVPGITCPKVASMEPVPLAVERILTGVEEICCNVGGVLNASTSQLVSYDDCIAPRVNSKSPKTILIKSTNLNFGDFLRNLDASMCPVIYDFQGKEMRYSETWRLRLNPLGVTLRNGSILLESSTLLLLEGSSVHFDCITFSGGAGVEISAGASVVMNDCKIKNMTRGILLTDNSSLVTNNVSIDGCTEQGILLCDRCSLLANSLSISDCMACAIELQDSSLLNATALTVSDCAKHGIVMFGCSKLVVDSLRISTCKLSAIVLNGSSSAEANTVSLCACQRHGLVLLNTSKLVVDGIDIVNSGQSSIELHNESCMEATNLKVTSSQKSGMVMRGSSSAKLTNCRVIAAKIDGINMYGNTRLVGERMVIKGVQGTSMSLSATSKASLTSCKIVGKSGYAGVLRDKASLALSGCNVHKGFNRHDESAIGRIVNSKFQVVPDDPYEVLCFCWGHTYNIYALD